MGHQGHNTHASGRHYVLVPPTCCQPPQGCCIKWRLCCAPAISSSWMLYVENMTRAGCSVYMMACLRGFACSRGWGVGRPLCMLEVCKTQLALSKASSPGCHPLSDALPS
jgi:hypothetical protein